MIFSSPLFIFVFLPLTFLVWRVLARTGKNTLLSQALVVASLVFYGSWNPKYLPLIIGSICINYGLSRLIAKTRELEDTGGRAKLWLAVGVLFNLGLLITFKYTDFFLSNLNILSGGEGPFLLHLTLPLGISFFTFQQIAFLADMHRGEVKTHNFTNYALFVSFFPQLIAGPIVHHKEMMPQFSNPKNRRLNFANISTGLFIFGIGLFKKVVLADSFSPWVAGGFDSLGPFSTIDAWSAALCYTLQIYFDFSGYTDMATGAALLFNIRLPLNFNSPYKSRNIAEFWRCWHITLGRWLRDYLYLPLGGNRISSLCTLRNLFIVMLLGGLWHGAGWTFVLWGVLHGLALIIHTLWSRTGIPLNGLVARAITFLFVVIAWVPFRAVTFDAAQRVWTSMFMPVKLDRVIMPESLPWIIAGLAVVMFLPNSMQLSGFTEGSRFRINTANPVHAVATGLLLAVATTWMLASTGTEFIYFNF